MPGVSDLQHECFFIAPIGAEGTQERRRSDGVLEFVVKRAAAEVGLTAVRGDQIAEPGQITLQVIEHVLGARAAVVDLTDLNPNVFYELAVRHTARLPVALIAEKDCPLPFDIAQMRTIFFEHTDLKSADECRRSIVSHLSEALDGAVDSPIATSVDVQSLQSGSIVERNVAELVTTVEEMAKSQRMTFDLVMQLRSAIRSTEDIPEAALSDLWAGLDRLRAIAAEDGDPRLDQVIHEMRFPVDYLLRKHGRPLSRAQRRQREEQLRRREEEVMRWERGRDDTLAAEDSRSASNTPS